MIHRIFMLFYQNNNIEILILLPWSCFGENVLQKWPFFFFLEHCHVYWWRLPVICLNTILWISSIQSNYSKVQLCKLQHIHKSHENKNGTFFSLSHGLKLTWRWVSFEVQNLNTTNRIKIYLPILKHKEM